ncbi:hypothetical protein KE622_12630 [Shewanella algae]|uniref:hypothetical protein n=1 Tax=Shewanella algae TaxID=38313 RepID=UPI000E32EC8C|nr:hypothetical protein [Shewanella algae]AXQ15852.1 hypothetical protein BS332_17915 [Shewanella algae]QXP18780.1 hypothetical protein KE621_17940 [Shewanella algae]QXP28341.1 hypothetical protein KE622_12630 [Shewanella algae]QXP34649.1 hypothetical protein KE623_02980 [Shewanella algae]QXP37535.1 hypothetical protein KE624_17510 [Shewanella algae]
MIAYVPITSIRGKSEKEAFLLHPGLLRQWYGLEGPLTLAKSYFEVKENEPWFIVLDDNGAQTVIISWQDERYENTKFVDITKILGHELVVMPWQKLILRKNSICESYISFIRT